jgi:aminopeptidase N
LDLLPLQNSNENQEKKSNPARQPRIAKVNHLKPELYQIELLPFVIPDNFTIQGKLELTMLCEEESKNVTLHSKNLVFEQENIELINVKNGKRISIIEHSYDTDREFYIAKLSQTLKEGTRYKISINYVTQLTNDNKGFYYDVYEDRTSELVEYYAATQFQITGARQVFPCLDEPALKARFAIKLGRSKDMSTISNMPISQKAVVMKGTNDYVWDIYEESVPMSTYLVAFAVTRYGYEEDRRTKNNVVFRTWARKDALDQVSYATEIGPKLLQYFEDYFKVPYPLPKQDQIALPGKPGAMENWGLITYPEQWLLYKSGVSGLENKQKIALVVSHELSHQWFGNLVTPTWWTDLWLNEGFASYAMFLGVDAIHPELKIMEYFMIDTFYDVLTTDALETSHPISIPVGHPDEIAEIFDKIS